MCKRTSSVAGALSVLIAAGAHAGVGDQVRKLLIDDGYQYDYLGTSVAMDGRFAIVGARHYELAGGAFVYDAYTYEQIATLVNPDGEANQRFGYAVAISGSIAIIGEAGILGSTHGAAYIIDVSTGDQIAKLQADGGPVANCFGCSVAIDGNVAIIGASQYNWAGAAFLFDATTGQQIGDPLLGYGFDEWFGESVDISGDRAIVGEPGGATDPGRAYIFDVNNGQLMHVLEPDGGASSGDNFGKAVAIAGDVALVGATGFGDSSDGAAYLFDVETGQQVAMLLPDDYAPGGGGIAQFGGAVALRGSAQEGIALVGAGSSFEPEPFSGSAYAFDVATGSQIAKLLPIDGDEDDRFGSAVAIGDGLAIVGAPYDDDYGPNSGAAYLFDLACRADLNDDGVVNSGDIASLIGAWGPAEPDAPADINHDGVIDPIDLAILLADWGGC